MKTANSEISAEDAVITWLRFTLGLRSEKRLEPSTRINIDLGVAGEDGIDLINAFEKHFSVDTTSISLNQHFGCEAGTNPIALAKSFGRLISGKSASELKPLYIADLINLVPNIKRHSPA